MSNKALSINSLAEVHRVSVPHLAKWKAMGFDIHDSRVVVEKIWGGRTKPPDWVDVFDRLNKDSDDDSHEGLKRAKTREEVEKLRIGNAKAKGELFDRADGEAVMVTWASALNLGMTELLAMLPPQLEGLDAAAIERLLIGEFDKLRDHLSDLGGDLWQKVYDQYITGIQESSAGSTHGRNHQAAAAPQSEPVVPRKRKAGPGANAKP